MPVPIYPRSWGSQMIYCKGRVDFDQAIASGPICIQIILPADADHCHSSHYFVFLY